MKFICLLILFLFDAAGAQEIRRRAPPKAGPHRPGPPPMTGQPNPLISSSSGPRREQETRVRSQSPSLAGTSRSKSPEPQRAKRKSPSSASHDIAGPSQPRVPSPKRPRVPGTEQPSNPYRELPHGLQAASQMLQQGTYVSQANFPGIQAKLPERPRGLDAAIARKWEMSLNVFNPQMGSPLPGQSFGVRVPHSSRWPTPTSNLAPSDKPDDPFGLRRFAPNRPPSPDFPKNTEPNLPKGGPNSRGQVLPGLLPHPKPVLMDHSSPQPQILPFPQPNAAAVAELARAKRTRDEKIQRGSPERSPSPTSSSRIDSYNSLNMPGITPSYERYKGPEIHSQYQGSGGNAYIATSDSYSSVGPLGTTNSHRKGVITGIETSIHNSALTAAVGNKVSTEIMTYNDFGKGYVRVEKPGSPVREAFIEPGQHFQHTAEGRHDRPVRVLSKTRWGGTINTHAQ